MSDYGMVKRTVIPTAYALLPDKMKSVEATAMLLATGLQESRMTYRRQIGGPARGLWQFESGGGWRGVLWHQQTRAIALGVLKELNYSEDPGYETLALDDILACVFARLLLWTHPFALPDKGESGYAWNYYLNLWRPGKPHPETWPGFYEQAWEGL